MDSPQLIVEQAVAYLFLMAPLLLFIPPWESTVVFIPLLDKL